VLKVAAQKVATKTTCGSNVDVVAFHGQSGSQAMRLSDLPIAHYQDRARNHRRVDRAVAA
jgi:hypothetical protein